MVSTLSYNIISSIIEFFKIYLLTSIIFQVHESKKIFVFFPISIIFLTLLSNSISTSFFSFISAMITIIFLIIFTYEKRKTGIIILSFLIIGCIDSLFSSLCIEIFHLTENDIWYNYPLVLAIDSFSFILLILICTILRHSKMNKKQINIKKYIFLYILGGFALVIYLSAIQVIGMRDDILPFHNKFVFALILCSIVLIISIILLIINTNRNERLNQEVIVSQKLLETQNTYFSMLLEKEQETKAFRHDIKNHLFCMNSLYQDGNYEELGAYLADLSHNAKDLSPKIQTGNELVSAIANDLSRKFSQISFHWKGLIPPEINLSSLDTCTIFYNLLSNAFEAAQKVPNGKIQVTIKFLESTMFFTIENSTSNEPKIKRGELVSDKNEFGHGYGVINAKKCIEQNKGTYSFEYKDGIFTTNVFLPYII